MPACVRGLTRGLRLPTSPRISLVYAVLSGGGNAVATRAGSAARRLRVRLASWARARETGLRAFSGFAGCVVVVVCWLVAHT